MPSVDMTPARQQGTRVRRKHSKTLTGCVSCKRRHMKCDEAKPNCQRCRKSGLTCEGYHYPKAKIFELSKPASTPITPPPDPEPQLHRAIPPASLHDDPPPMILRDTNISWRRALLEAFFAACIPDVHEWNSLSISNLTGPLPYAPWPSVTWQLARADGQGLVAQALSCLTLVALGMKTKRCMMIAKARLQYDTVLCRLQAEMNSLQDIHDPPAWEHQINLLASVGFCCAQFEYMLGSWENGDRHIQGMVSLWQIDSSRPLHADSQSMFYDAWLLCMACSVTNHQAPAYSPTDRAQTWASTSYASHGPLRQLLSTSEQIACLLQEHDQRARYREVDSTPHLLEPLETALQDLDEFVKLQEFASMAEWLEAHSEPLQSAKLSSLEALPAAVLSGYASSFVLQSIGTAWKLTRMQSRNSFQASHLAEVHMQQMCENHLARVCQLVQDLYDQRYKMVTVSTLLHLIDSARVGFATLWEFCGGSTTVATPWFVSIGNHVASTGSGDLRQPWQDSQCIKDNACHAPLVANILLGGPISE